MLGRITYRTHSESIAAIGSTELIDARLAHKMPNATPAAGSATEVWVELSWSYEGNCTAAYSLAERPDPTRLDA